MTQQTNAELKDSISIDSVMRKYDTLIHFPGYGRREL